MISFANTQKRLLRFRVTSEIQRSVADSESDSEISGMSFETIFAQAKFIYIDC